MLSGGISQALRKCDMFSICMKGMGDFLKRTPGFGTARLINLRRVSALLSHHTRLRLVFTGTTRSHP
jgi:hypothetical protein